MVLMWYIDLNYVIKTKVTKSPKTCKLKPLLKQTPNSSLCQQNQRLSFYDCGTKTRIVVCNKILEHTASVHAFPRVKRHKPAQGYREIADRSLMLRES